MSNEEAFANELIGYIFTYPDDEYMTMECLCRKLYKHGLIERKDGEWTCNFIKQAESEWKEWEMTKIEQNVEMMQMLSKAKAQLMLSLVSVWT